jgi:hypothetical protein
MRDLPWKQAIGLAMAGFRKREDCYDLTGLDIAKIACHVTVGSCPPFPTISLSLYQALQPLRLHHRGLPATHDHLINTAAVLDIPANSKPLARLTTPSWVSLTEE